MCPTCEDFYILASTDRAFRGLQDEYIQAAKIGETLIGTGDIRHYGISIKDNDIHLDLFAFRSIKDMVIRGVWRI